MLVDDGVARDEPTTTRVGTVHWYGRHVGNHHLGAGLPRDVEFLKGVNCAYRRAALGLPLGLRGAGAQAHFEVAAGRFARRLGFSLLYDPSLVVEHHPADRHGGDQRRAPSDVAVADASYNLVVAIGGVRGLCRVPYAVLVGDRGAPGVARAAWALVRADRGTVARACPPCGGRWRAGSRSLRGRSLTYDTFL